jgi:hypothetical protein
MTKSFRLKSLFLLNVLLRVNLLSVKEREYDGPHKLKIPLSPDFVLTEKETQHRRNFPSNAFTQRSCG